MIPAISENKYQWQEVELWEEYERRKDKNAQIASTPSEYEELNRKDLEELGL